MDFTSFLGFPCPNLLIVFSELLVIVRNNLYHILSQVLGLSLFFFVICFCI